MVDSRYHHPGKHAVFCRRRQVPRHKHLGLYSRGGLQNQSGLLSLLAPKGCRLNSNSTLMIFRHRREEPGWAGRQAGKFWSLRTNVFGSEWLPVLCLGSTLPGQHLHSHELGLKLNIMFCFIPKSNLVKQRTYLLSPSQ